MIEAAEVRIETERYALTIDQAAELTGLSRDSIEAAHTKGELPFHYPSPRKPLILPAELKAWLVALPTEPPTKVRARR